MTLQLNYHGDVLICETTTAVYGGLGIGLYAPVRKIICGKGDPEQAPIWCVSVLPLFSIIQVKADCRKRIVAGMITGGTGQAVATPLDVVKVRVQADGRLRALGETPRYTSSFAAFRRIPAEEGIRGMYRGAWASIQRAAVINGCGIASYDYTKHLILRWLGSDDGLQARVLGALTSGLVSATVSTPFDVVKTRLMNQHEGKKLYSGTIDCVKKTVAGEGTWVGRQPRITSNDLHICSSQFTHDGLFSFCAVFCCLTR